jgi:hypothetical protein
MSRLRCPLVSLAALAVYLAASVAVRGVHHHAMAARPATDSRYAALVPAAGPADDGDHPCPICEALFLAQAFPIDDPPRVTDTPTGDAVALVAVHRPHTPPRGVHSRAPPSR